MNPLYRKPPDTIVYEGVTYPLDLAFGKVLQYLDMVSDGTFSESDMTEVALSWFLPRTKVKRLDPVTRAGILSKIRSEFISTPNRTIRGKKSKQTVDFRHDSGYIYAAFVQAYGIDLYECADTLPWCKFIALFSALPDETAMSRIMSIRGRELPAPNNYNRDEIQQLTELKLIYALPQKQSEANVQKALGGLFELLYEKAIKAAG